ncbi:hypothetical protein G6011_03094 [Alternaria panax]|uniref:Uncharacterized protein n=1 Tax=Alternaria panax TaxID=48097 RepID=A0AAD4NST0_9PLEO|nr:hypothetical protein G6011_03094 [Alternaria panax]
MGKEEDARNFAQPSFSQRYTDIQVTPCTGAPDSPAIHDRGAFRGSCTYCDFVIYLSFDRTFHDVVHDLVFRIDALSNEFDESQQQQ